MSFDPTKSVHYDLHKLTEDQRIEMIGHNVMAHNRIITFLVDGDSLEPGKADRYMRKLKERFPGIQELERGSHPQVPAVVYIRVGPPVN